MIHRFVDLLEAPAALGIIIYKVRTAGSRNQYWLAGGGATPSLILSADYPGATADLFRARLSPDGTQIVYTYSPASGASELRVGSVSASGTTTIATAAASGKAIENPFWHPDGTKILYCRESSTSLYDATHGYAEIRSVNVDGTGDTLLYTRASTATGLPYFNLDSGARYNLDGTLIAWFDDGQTISSGSTVCGVWVMNSDGTGASRRVASSVAGSIGGTSGFLGWSKTSTSTFALLDFNPSGGATRLAKATTAGAVTILQTPVSVIPGFDYVWFPDDSAIVGAHFIYGTEPKAVVSKSPVPGGGTTDLSPEQRTLWSLGGNFFKPCVFFDRIYWFNNSTNRVESVLEDGSDFTVDHDLAGTGLSFQTFIL